jgi:hypothetical protein
VFRPAPRGNGALRNNGIGRTQFSQGVPGLGFDYPHFAATHPGFDHFHGRNRGFVGAYFPFFGGGYYWPIFPEDVDEGTSDNQQAEAAAPETPQAPQEAPQNYAPQAYAPAPQSYAPAPQPAPTHEADQYVFVRRDGTVFFAVAYAWENGMLRYVTSEGLRRSVSGDKLDLEATQQFNEQRGLVFHLPA